MIHSTRRWKNANEINPLGRSKTRHEANAFCGFFTAATKSKKDMGSAFLFLTTLYKQQTNSRRKWKKNKVINESNWKSIITADDHLIFSKQHPSIHPSVHFCSKTVGVIQPKSMRSVTLSSVFEFVPVSFKEITNCLRFITLRTCAQSTAKQQKSSKRNRQHSAWANHSRGKA